MTDQHMAEKKLLIFLSHASQDKVKVRNLCKRLRKDGFDPWLDEERLIPGQDWNLEIEKALRASDIILLCFSSLSVAKEGYIQREYKQAIMHLEEKPEGMIFVIPVRLDDCELPHFIREIQWVDYPADYDRLLMSLQVRVGGAAMPSNTKKLKAKKPTSKPTRAKLAGGNIFHIQGDIHIGRDMVAGDQINVHRETVTNITSRTQFIDELQDLKKEIEWLKTQPNVDISALRRLVVVQADIDDAIEEAKKEAPAAERITNTLKSADETMKKLDGGISSAVKLGTTLGNLGLMAMKLFGG